MRNQISKPLKIYGVKVREILYYKELGDIIRYWSIADERGRLEFANMED